MPMCDPSPHRPSPGAGTAGTEAISARGRAHRGNTDAGLPTYRSLRKLSPRKFFLDVIVVEPQGTTSS